MCVDREMFLNRRTMKDGYIDIGNDGTRLSATQQNDLQLAVKWLKCRYNFSIDEIVDFLDVPVKLVKAIYDVLPCHRCHNVLRYDRCRKAKKDGEGEVVVLQERRKRRKTSVSG
ncbi:MAG: hypothetical protein IMW93_05075 [Thermoanaerobacteraceae bacterium]|nr:hypothetical protein [Thermoanaerobacteraceae bacterium]